MCSTCGCSSDEPVKLLTPGKQGHFLLSRQSRELHKLELNILNKNELEAAHNRKHFENNDVLAINMVSSPGSGKTTILEKTINALKKNLSFYIVEGDQQTMRDAIRIQATGVSVLQINTGKACHLDAHMIHEAVHQIEPKPNSIFIIENVGNLVCPALFDLGEKFRVVVISVTEGDDKPIKYPYMFESANLCIINKIDLLPYVDFNIDKVKKYALEINHKLNFFEVSATNGEGMSDWYNWIYQQADLKL